MYWRSEESGPNKYPSLHLQKLLGTEHPCSAAPGDIKHITQANIYDYMLWPIAYALCTL